MKVKVIKAKQDSSYWYANSLGKTFPVLGTIIFNGLVKFEVPKQDDTEGKPYVSGDDCHIIIGGCEFALIESTE
jgi:hypothetical protein